MSSPLDNSRIATAWSFLAPVCEAAVRAMEKQALAEDVQEHVLAAHFKAQGARYLLNVLTQSADNANQAIKGANVNDTDTAIRS